MKLPIFIRDTREKPGKGFFWPESHTVSGTQKAALKYGDYSIKGHEKDFVIERKGRASEFLSNLIGKDRARFHRELKKLSTCKMACIVCEFDFSDLCKKIDSFPRFTRGNLMANIASINCNYGVPIFFASNNEMAKELSQSLLLKAVKHLK